MKILKPLLLVCFLVTTFTQAQTAEEIISNYLENTGGKANWDKVKGIKKTGSISAQGMTIPVDIVTFLDGRMYIELDFQGMKFKQIISDGKHVWMTNPMTQETRQLEDDKTDAILGEFKSQINPFLNYKKNGYKVALLGSEKVEETDCFKVELTKKPVTVDGEEIANKATFYFDKETFVPILKEVTAPSGPMKGQIIKSPMGDYQEAGGVFFPFSMNMQGNPMTFTNIVVNPSVTAEDFAKPANVVTSDENKDATPKG